MSRTMKIFVAILLMAVAIGAVYFRGLHRQVLQLAQREPPEHRIRQELTQPAAVAPGTPRVKAQLFFAAGKTGAVEPIEVELALAADPVARAKELIRELIASPPSPEARTLPAEAVLIEFYLLPDGAAVADFSDTLATAMPAGILSEQAAVNSILRTLEANVPSIRRLKILINGQEEETLAGHLDLTDFFELHPPAAPLSGGPAAQAGGLTRPEAPGKLQHE